MGKHSINPENWYQRDHQSIYQTAQAFDSSKVTETSQKLCKVAEELHSIMNTTGQKVQNIILADWRGQAAETAQEGFSALFKRSDSIVDTTRQIANVLPALGHAMDTTKASIEPPVSATTAMATASTDSELLAAANLARAAEQQHAQYQMTSLFSQPVVDTSNTVDDVPNPTQSANAGQSGHYSASTSTTGVSGSKTPGQVDAQIDNLDGIGRTNSAFDRGTQDVPVGQGQPGSGQGGQPAAGGPGSGSTPGGAPPSMGSPNDPGRTRAAAAGLDEDYFSRNRPILQDPLGRNTDKWGPITKAPFGQDRFDGVTSAGRAGPMPAAGAVPPGTRGTGPMGMMPMNSRAGRDEQKDHQIPRELINQDNTDELIGQLRNGAPAVIGGLTAEEIQFQKEHAAPQVNTTGHRRGRNNFHS